MTDEGFTHVMGEFIVHNVVSPEHAGPAPAERSRPAAAATGRGHANRDGAAAATAGVAQCARHVWRWTLHTLDTQNTCAKALQ